MILHNARIHTLGHPLATASALAIAGGRVIGGVDSREDAIASHAHERIDLQGATVVPGFVDAHVHFRAWALSRVLLDLRGARDLDTVLAAVSNASHDDRAWVIGFGWADEAGRAAGPEAARLLDRAASGKPAALISKDGHALWTTPRALRELTIDENALDTPGGVVERGPDGEFAGILREESAWLVRRALPQPDATTATFAKAMREANARGVTAVHDMDGAAGLDTWRLLETERGLTLRVWQFLLAHELEHAAALNLWPNFGGERVRIAGIKVFLDGTLSSGTAWMHDPETVAPEGARRDGVIITDATALTDIVTRAAHAGMSVAAHAIGDAATSTALDVFEDTRALWERLPHRPRIEHAQLMRDGDFARAGELDVMLSVQPTHLASDRDIADERWEGRTPRAYAYRSMLDAGAPLLLGSDAPIEDLDPLAAIRVAVERSGDERPAWHPQQALTREQALHACTTTPARAVGMEGQFGALTPGRQADLVVLSGDPLVDPLSDIEVVATMVGGRWVHGRTHLA